MTIILIGTSLFSSAKTFDVPDRQPNLCGKQMNIDNYLSNAVSDYFKNRITSTFINHLNNEL